uniref:Porin n=1 Tax=Parastrongyloides trichosuri TaxID=131310 RepID=A0A0N5A623_PARTI
MRNVLLAAAAMSVLAVPAFAQSNPEPRGYGSLGYTHMEGDAAQTGAVSGRLGVDLNRYLAVETEVGVGVKDKDITVAGVDGQINHDASAAGNNDSCSASLWALLHKNRARRITCAEAADQTRFARREALVVQMEGDDRSGRGGVGVVVQDDDVLARLRLATQHLPADQGVHVDVGLVQPQTLQSVRVQAQFGGVVQDHLRHHRHHLLEHLATLLDEHLVAQAVGRDGLMPVGRQGGAVQKAEIVADVVREAGLQLRAQNVPAARPGLILGLDDDGRGDVAEDEVAVAILEVQVRRADFWVHHQHGLDRARGHEVRRRLDAEGGRAARNVHVEGEALNAQRLLHLNGHGGVGALHVRRGADDGADLADRLAPGLDGVLRGLHRHFGQDRQLVVAARGQIGQHPLGVDDARLVHDVARLDARGLLDEGFGRGRLGLDLSGGDGLRVGRVPAFRPRVVGADQLLVRDRLFRREQAGGGDDGFLHCMVP